MAVLSPEISHREHFAQLCNQRGLLTHAVEIGTHKAVFAVAFLNVWKGDHFVCIDPWQAEIPGYAEMQWNRWPDLIAAMCNLAVAKHIRRVDFFPVTSEEAIGADYIQWPIDFLYVDGNHLEEFVEKDIRMFWPHVADEGFMAGHDYDQDKPGVVAAVEAFAEAEGRTVYLTHEPRFKSWYVYKNENTKILPRMITCGVGSKDKR